MGRIIITPKTQGVKGSANLDLNFAKYIIYFRRNNNYQGEYGFDWMRDEYSEICAEFNKLEQDYQICYIYNTKYYIPWLLIHKRQSDINNEVIKLKLELKIIEGEISDSDIITIDTKGKIECTPLEIPLKTFSKDNDGTIYTEIILKCKSPLPDTFKLEVKNQHQTLVGALSILDNKIEYNVPLHFFKLLSDNEKANEEYFEYLDSKWINDCVNHINKYGLIQAGIQCKLDKIKEINVNTEEWVRKGYLPERTRVDSNIAKGVKQYYSTEKGICVFLIPFMQVSSKQGRAWARTNPTTDNYIICPPYFTQNGTDFAKEVLLHEIGHVLGLGHNFLDQNKTKQRNNITIYRNNLKINASIPDDQYISKDKTMKEEREIINREIEILESKSGISFKIACTDNIMDYPIDIETNTRNKLECISFSVRQWKIMQQEVKQYHGTIE